MLRNSVRKPRTRPQTNPRYASFTQAIFTAGDSHQFNATRRRSNLTRRDYTLSSDNIFVRTDRSCALLDTRITWEKYRNLSSVSVSNTFRYLFHKFKKGIFVKIENGEIVTFLPFLNANYRNEFADRIKQHPSFETVQNFLDHVADMSGFRRQHALPINEWYANNALVRYEHKTTEGDNNEETLRDMFVYVASVKRLPDSEFFINRRDFPLLKTTSTEPYNHIYNTNDKPLLSHNYKEYSPILSGSTATDFADIAFPTYEDWARCRYQDNGTRLPGAYREYPQITAVEWDKKKPIAVFRGSTTGAGTTPQTNQRLNAFERGQENTDMLDVGITSWQLRPRKYEGDPYMRTIERDSYPIANRLSLQEQAEYKYILNLEGHVAAYRLSYELSSGSVVLLADSKWKIWYHDYLLPFVHYVPVAEDLSDLIDKIRWCRDNDERCKEIAINAKIFYDKYLSLNGVVEYIEFLLFKMTDATGFYSTLPNLTSWTVDSEWDSCCKRNLDERYERYDFDLPNSSRCIGRLDGTSIVFRSKTVKELSFVDSIFQNRNGSIDMFRVNNFYLVRKRATSDDKKTENKHETFIGMNVVNKLLAKVPNFAYVYGNVKDDDDDDDTDVYVEYINGTTLNDWLTSTDYTLETHIFIMIQICMALQMAQEYYGFIHYDLYPWNVVIQKLKTPAVFDYVLANESFRVETDVVPIIIDYGKSRAIVAEEEFGLIDHGIVNLYRSSSCIDVLTLLFSSLKVAADRLSKDDVERLLLCVSAVKIDANEYRYYSKYGTMFSNDAVMSSNFSPYDFITELLYEFDFGASKRIYPVNDYTIKMEFGNALFTSAQMRRGNDQLAFLDVIGHIDRSTFPVETDLIFDTISAQILKRRIDWIAKEIERKGDAFVKKKWNTIERRLSTVVQKYKTFGPTLDIPRNVRSFTIDENVSSSIVRRIVCDNDLITIRDDWCAVKLLCLETSLFDNRLDFGDIVGVKGFRWLNAIAINNTLMKIYTTFIDPTRSKCR